MRGHEARRRKPVEITETNEAAQCFDCANLVSRASIKRSNKACAFISLIRFFTNLGKLELVMGKLVGYGLRKPGFADVMGYMLGVCLKTFTFTSFYRQ